MINYLLKPYNNIVNNVIINYKKEKFIQEKPEECPICYEYLEDIEDNLLECGHWFHYKCILKTKNINENSHFYKCPICRKQVEILVKEYKNLSVYLLISSGVIFSYLFLSEKVTLFNIEKLPNLCEYIICHLF